MRLSDPKPKSNRPLVNALRRRPRLHAGLIQLGYVAAGFVLGTSVARINRGPTMASSSVVAVLASIGGGIILLVSIVFSLLFLVVQFGATTFTPRLTIFRDNPLVWHSFGFFVGLFVFATTASLTIGNRTEVSVWAPGVAMTLTLVAFWLMLRLQMTAYASVQLSTTLSAIAARGRVVLDALYTEPFDTAADVPVAVPAYRRAPQIEVRWRRAQGVLGQVDLPKLVAAAQRTDAVVELKVPVGELVHEDAVVFVVYGAKHPIDGEQLVEHLEVGPERSFNQDPLFAFRLLTDIGLRALSPAINDPATGMQSIDALGGLLRTVAARRLDVGDVADDFGHPRVVLPVPRWADYVAAAVDEIAFTARRHPAVSRRLYAMVNEVIALAPPRRRPELERRRDWIRANATFLEELANPAMA